MRIFLKAILILIIISFSLAVFSYNFGEKEALVRTDTKDQFKAVTYNIHKGTDKQGKPSLNKITDILQKEDPDFIALQEVFRYKSGSGLNDQIKFLSKKLNMYYVFGPNIDFGAIEYGNGILTKYPILEWGQVKLAYENEPRSLLWAKVKTENGIIYITSTHLGLDTKKRSEHFNIIENFIYKTNDPVLIMGDFNVLPNHQAFYDFRTSVTGKLFFQEIPTYISHNQQVQIDYVFGRKIIELDSYAIPSEASDHYPLFLNFKIKP